MEESVRGKQVSAGGLADLVRELASAADPERAKSSAWFFKTGKGEYGEGDQFLGIRVPAQRKIALGYLHLRLPDVQRLLKSPVHEHRFTATEILVAQYERATEPQAQRIFDFYLKNARRFNNWDLVDTSAPYVVGDYLLDRPREVLHELAQSSNVWERRIAIVATFAFLKRKETNDTFRIAGMLLGDSQDLIHKAIGWALREAGTVSRERLLKFLERNYQALPRTTLRYAIEHLPPGQRKLILTGKF